MNKLVQITLTSLLILALAGAIAYIVILNVKADPLGDLVKYSYTTPEITTDIQGDSFVRIQFHVVTDGKKALKEISKRDFQLRNILIKELALLSEEEFTTNLSGLEEIVKEKINELMTEGQVIDVYTISKILQ